MRKRKRILIIEWVRLSDQKERGVHSFKERTEGETHSSNMRALSKRREDDIRGAGERKA